MKKIGILYICTGQYYLFWEDFYKTFKEKFCTNSELHFFVFSNQKMNFAPDKNIHFHEIQNQPWPLITLLRFNTFLSIEDELKEMDYLFFFNSNIVCNEQISEEEFLPSDEEELVFVRHPGYCYKSKIYFPYDRNSKSSAYIPYNRGKTYVIGAVEGGKTNSFLAMCNELKKNIEEDLKKNIIARWHDESQINHYILIKRNYKLLHPGYCYPVGFDLPFERKISGVSKQAKFDVNSFKFSVSTESKFKTFMRKANSRIIPLFLYIRDLLLFKRERIN